MFWNKGTKKESTNTESKLNNVLKEDQQQGTTTEEYDRFYSEMKKVQNEKEMMKEVDTVFQVQYAFYHEWPVISISSFRQLQRLKQWSEGKGVEVKDYNTILTVDDIGGTLSSIIGLYAVYAPRQKALKILKQDTTLTNGSFRRPLWAKPIVSSYDAMSPQQGLIRGQEPVTANGTSLVNKNGTHHVTVDGVQYEVQGSVTLEGRVVVK